MDQNPPPSASATPVLFDEPMSLLMQLWSTSKAIPILVPYGVSGDVLAQLSGDPACGVVDIDPDEVWEYLNKAMDQVLGYGISAEELLKLIHCGPLGMDGVCNWMERDYG